MMCGMQYSVTRFPVKRVNRLGTSQVKNRRRKMRDERTKGNPPKGKRTKAKKAVRSTRSLRRHGRERTLYMYLHVGRARLPSAQI